MDLAKALLLPLLTVTAMLSVLDWFGKVLHGDKQNLSRKFAHGGVSFSQQFVINVFFQVFWDLFGRLERTSGFWFVGN